MKWNQRLMALGALCAALTLSACGGGAAPEPQNDVSPEPMAETVTTVQEQEEEYVLPQASETMTAEQDVRNYLNIMALSRQRLIDQLLFDGFSEADAIAAVDNCGADWKEEAVKQAKSYLDTMEFTRDELIDQLEYDKFTSEEAVYGVDNCGADWK